MDLDDILRTLIDDLIVKKIMPKGTKLNDLPRVELAKVLLNNYLPYPLPSKIKAFFPYNYCMVSQFLGKTQETKKFIRKIESFFCKSNFNL